MGTMPQSGSEFSHFGYLWNYSEKRKEGSTWIGRSVKFYQCLHIHEISFLDEFEIMLEKEWARQGQTTDKTGWSGERRPYLEYCVSWGIGVSVRVKGLKDKSSSYSLLSSLGLALKIAIEGETRWVISFCQEKSIILKWEGTKHWYLKLSLSQRKPW